MRGICLDKTRVILNQPCTLGRSGLKTLTTYGLRVPFEDLGVRLLSS